MKYEKLIKNIYEYEISVVLVINIVALLIYAQDKYYNYLLEQISLTVITSSIFYVIIVYIPAFHKNHVLKKSFIEIYRHNKKEIIKTIFAFLEKKDIKDIDEKIIDDLMSPTNLREYLVKQNDSSLSRQDILKEKYKNCNFGNVLLKMENIRKEIIYLLNILSIHLHKKEMTLLLII